METTLRWFPATFLAMSAVMVKVVRTVGLPLSAVAACDDVPQPAVTRRAAATRAHHRIRRCTSIGGNHALRRDVGVWSVVMNVLSVLFG